MKHLLKTKFIVLFAILTVGLLYFIPQGRILIEKTFYDFIHKNEYVSSKKQARKVLDQFEHIPARSLPKTYLTSTGMALPRYRKMISGMSFFKLTKKDTYKKIAGNIRIMDLLSKDAGYYTLFYWSKKEIYWGIKPAIIDKVIDLQKALEREGYNKNAFTIRNGHRYPLYNEKKGGASKSRHIVGGAVDMVIGDINEDGKFTAEDKQIVIDLCEKEIIGNKGGIGKYPGSRTVHIDVRGYKARWDSY